MNARSVATAAVLVAVAALAGGTPAPRGSTSTAGGTPAPQGTTPAPQGRVLPELVPTGLRCEYAIDPLGIDVARPRLFWRLESTERGARQTAWRVLVASTSDRLAADDGDLWDSGRVASDQTTHIVYSGKPLASSQQVFWKVRVWHRVSRESAWSRPATWTMGVMTPDEWKGVWIAAPGSTETLLLRQTVTVKPGLRRAVVHVSGLGQYELSVNGRKVGQDLLAPGWTNYDRTALYDTYDVTGAVHEGRNGLGIFLGNGMYHVVRRNRFAKFTGSFGPLRAILHLRLDYAAGAVEFVGTDDTWRVHAGPITYSSIYGGEDYDARLEQKGWDTAGFDARGWARAVPVIRLDNVLRGHTAAADPIREIESRRAVSQRTLPNGSVVYDFGQNASFMPRLRVAGPAGTTIRLTPAEVVADDGSLDRRTMGSAARGSSWWQYTKATDREEGWFPRFYYVGSRYVQAEFFPPGEVPAAETDQRSLAASPPADPARLPRVVSLDAVIVHASAPPVGRFSSASALLNRIHDLVRWAQRSNMVSVLTDCPHREKLGWLEQYHLNGPSIRYEFDTARIFTKAMQDMADAQTEAGLVPDIAPEFTEFKGGFRDSPEWGSAFILVPWQQLQFDGDVGLLRRHYEAMKRYFAYLESMSRDNLLAHGLGDWYDLDLAKKGQANLTPPRITATAFYYLDASTLSVIAQVLGKSEDARAFAAKAEAIRDRYNREFFDRASGTYATGSQASLAIPLAMGIVDGANRKTVLDALVRDVQQRGYATAGDIGFRWLLQALAQNGRSDVVYALINQDEKPGYGYQLKKGATSLTEAWDASLTSSHNHFMLGQIVEWFYQDLAGIAVDPASPGFKGVVIRPQPVGDLAWVEATYDSLHGPISVRWERRGGQLVLSCTLPANTTGTVWVPAREGTVVLEGGSPAEGQPGVRFVRREGDRAVYRVESGHYRFQSSW